MKRVYLAWLLVVPVIAVCIIGMTGSNDAPTWEYAEFSVVASGTGVRFFWRDSVGTLKGENSEEFGRAIGTLPEADVPTFLNHFGAKGWELVSHSKDRWYIEWAITSYLKDKWSASPKTGAVTDIYIFKRRLSKA